MFKGETLRGLLLNAYAFGTMGTIAGIAAIIAAAVMLVLGGLGLMHSRCVSPDTEVLTRRPARGTAASTAPRRSSTLPAARPPPDADTPYSLLPTPSKAAPFADRPLRMSIASGTDRASRSTLVTVWAGNLAGHRGTAVILRPADRC